MAVKLNREGREIWFQPILWGWAPSHWKGWAFLAGLIFAANACVWLLIEIAKFMGQSDAVWPFLILFPFIAYAWWLAARHSPSKDFS